MQQVYWIKSSQTWTCPKSGAWRIICVGGGASGGLTFHANVSALQSAGGTTSFGSLLSASGGAIEACSPMYIKSCGGYGGFDGINYGGAPAFKLQTGGSDPVILLCSSTINGGTLGSSGLGYGAGGSVGNLIHVSIKNNTSPSNVEIYAVPGKCGGMTMGIFDLTLNQSISCTVGNSSKPAITASTLIQQYKKASPNITEVTDGSVANVSAAVTAGTSGVIYIEFLG